MKRNSTRALVSSLALVLAAWLVPATQAEARSFAGKIVTSDKRIPTSAKSKSAYYQQLRKQSRTQFREDKNKQWVIHYAAFFRQPLNDLEVTIKLYDVTGKQRRLVASFEQWLNTRGQKEIISQLKLDREKFGVNRDILMTVENRNRVIASGKFKIVGEAERYKGRVDFSEEEANSSAP